MAGYKANIGPKGVKPENRREESHSSSFWQV